MLINLYIMIRENQRFIETFYKLKKLYYYLSNINYRTIYMYIEAYEKEIFEKLHNSKDNILFLFRIINNLMYELKMNREKIVAS
jgi:hypothetical protein